MRGLVLILRIVFLLGFFALAAWGFLWLDAKVSGWARLAEHYEADAAPKGAEYFRIDGMVGNVRMIRIQKLATAGMSNEGLYLAYPRLARPGHPALLIPWSAVSSHESSDVPIVGHRVTMSVGPDTPVTITLYNEAAWAAERYLNK